LHPQKIIINKIHSGVDFLGYINLPHYKILRTKTKKRIFNKVLLLKLLYKNKLIDKEYIKPRIKSYLGIPITNEEAQILMSRLY
jgi:hypothetical protein